MDTWLTILLTFTATWGAIGLVALLGLWRLSLHLRRDPFAAGALIEHLFVPLFAPAREAKLSINVAGPNDAAR